MTLKARNVLWILFFIFISLQAIAQNNFTIEGRVVDLDTKQPLKNVSVIVRQTKTGTTTNDSGYFKLKLYSPDQTIVFSFVGYVHNTRELHLMESNKPINIELKKKANEQLDEVVVNAYKQSSKVKSVEMNVIKINPELIKRSPLVFGEADIIKALVLQPGVTTTGEGAGGFNVRGGNADQNLVLIDGAPLFSTSHLLGFYTSVSTDAVQDITLYKGGMPSEYGGRLSSLLNMKIKNGNNNEMQYTGGVGPMSARFFMNGPLLKNKLTFTVGGRAAYPDLILNQLGDKFGASRAFFYDGIIKAEYSINENNKLSVTGYRSYDKFKFDTTTRYDWQTNLVTLNYTSNFTSKLSFKLNANYSQFISGINGLQTDYAFRLRSSIAQKQAKASFAYAVSDKNKIQIGIDYILYNISPGSQTPSSSSSSINPITIQSEQGREMAAFINDDIEFTDRISLQVGLRYTNYNYLGAKTVYHYQPGVPLSKETITDSVSYAKGKNIQGYGGLEPRVALKIGLSDDLSLKLSYNRGQQFLHLISNTTAISPVDFWKLSDNYSNRQIGDQYAAGLFKTFEENKYEASFETYYKSAKNTVQYKDGATLLLNPYIESSLLNGRGRAYGAEFSVAKNIGIYTWQINYTYSKSQVQVLTSFPSEKVNGGIFYPSDIDRPHNLAVVGKIKLGRGWSFSSNFIYTSGRPATYPDGTYAYNGTIVTNYSERNMDRLPAYHRLDVGFIYISKRYPEQKKYSIWNISFYNVYAHQNAYSIYFQRDQDRLLSYRLSVLGSVIPSISWNFNF
jgi:CarboxypepD_reg-like domain/TonB dependent receptor/TonB-dependent Receptor Plug Domain